MKYEWKKHEKHIYLPKNKPELVRIPEFNYFTVEGEGDPNEDKFSEYIRVLYSLSYAVKMSPKKGIAPEGYFDYMVYPLEGIWDINEEAKKRYECTFDKKDLVFKLMIRQPEFVNESFAQKIIEITKEKKYHELLEKVRFESIAEGTCIQMMHLGSYDDEPKSFKVMVEFAAIKNLVRKSKVHKEIYLSDARKTASEKLKTVLRFQVRESEG